MVFDSLLSKIALPPPESYSQTLMPKAGSFKHRLFEPKFEDSPLPNVDVVTKTLKSRPEIPRN